jgi:ABC-type sugar transport system substrate-binding protein
MNDLRILKWFARTLGLLLVAFMGLTSLPANAADGMSELKGLYSKAIEGKKIAFLPMSLGAPLMDTWEYVIRTEAARSKMVYSVKDPAWNSTALVQAFEGVLANKPDIIVVQNPNVQLLTKQIARAKALGIYVIQLSMMSNTLSDGYVGGDWTEQAVATAQDMIKECGSKSGKSGKIVILQGELTSAQNIYMVTAMMKEFAKDKAIKVVSSQATNWDATKAYDITTAVLQQHPDICAIFGPYDIMTIGGAQAVKKAGLSDKILVYSNAGGYVEGCNAVRDGLIDKLMDWEAWNQGREVMVMAKNLLMSGQKPGTLKLASFSSYFWVTKNNLDTARCTTIPKS